MLSKPDFVPKFLQNSDFRPCITDFIPWVTCFSRHEENLKPKYKRFFEFYWGKTVFALF